MSQLLLAANLRSSKRELPLKGRWYWDIRATTKGGLMISVRRLMADGSYTHNFGLLPGQKRMQSPPFGVGQGIGIGGNDAV